LPSIAARLVPYSNQPWKSDMTQDQINKLAALAVSVCSLAPLRFPPKQPGTQCYIPRDVVKQIRAVLDEGKYDWRAQHHSRRGK
jgi:hypothetical protein